MDLLRWVVALIAALSAAFMGVISTALPSSAAGQTVTYGATVSIPAPPTSNFAGAGGGGDGWAVALTSTQIFNVFHHSPTLMVNCHNQADASECWTSYKTITDTSGNNFSTSGQPGMYIDQASGHLYVYATRTSDFTAGVVCVDTGQPASNPDPFCGFTALSAPGDAPLDTGGYSGITDPVLVGHEWYAFNSVAGAASGTRDALMCFDVASGTGCASQPFAVDFGGGSVGTSAPSPGIASVAGKVFIQVAGVNEVACFDPASGVACTGSWPVASASGFGGAPLPLLSSTGAQIGVCVATPTASCWNLDGSAAATPSGFGSYAANDSWNSPAAIIGSRIYIPQATNNDVQCYDFSIGAGCANFPVSFSGLNYLYTVNPDPFRPTCLWVNANGGASQIQNFDAYTGGSCANAPLRLLASSIVNTSNDVCVPATWTDLQVLSPSPTAYTSGTVSFDDPDGNPIPGVAVHNLDATGSTDLTDLNLPSTDALPQFVLTLTGTSGSLGLVQIHVTWSGTYDPACVQGTASVPTATAPGAPAAPSVDAGDNAAAVTWTPPASDGYSPITGYTATAYDADSNVAGSCTAGAPATSCRITGLTDGQPYTFAVAATNAVGSTPGLASSAVTPLGPSVSTSLPAGDVSTPYSEPLSASGGQGPYTWSIASGTLPDGLSLSPSGQITGTPSTPGTSSVTFQVTDANGVSATGTVEMTINALPALPPTARTTVSSGSAVNRVLSPTGGTSPYSWTLLSGALPPGLTLDGDGTLHGTADTPGIYTATVQVADANGQTSSQRLTINVQSTDLRIASTSLPGGDVSTPYSQSLSPSGGVSPYTWSVISGTLPSGLSLSAAGQISGIPTAAGTSSFTVGVTDASTATATTTLEIVVSPLPSISPLPPATAPAGRPLKLALTPNGGTGPYTWSVVSGSLPPGVTLGRDGTLQGSSTSPGVYTFTVSVTDANGQSVQQSMTLDVQASNLNTRPIASTPDGSGYWIANPQGTVTAFGTAPNLGSVAAVKLAAPIEGIASSLDGHGYWMVAGDGGVFAFGDAKFFGSAATSKPHGNVVGITPTPDGRGYWLVGADGGVFAFGDAGFYGSTAGTTPAGSIQSLAATPDAHGYWLVGSDGGVFAFGDAGFYGSAAGTHLNAPIVGIAATSSGQGYWLVGSDGGVFTYGDAGYYGSMGGRHLDKPASGILPSPGSKGYWIVARDGGVFSFGDAVFHGSIPGLPR